MSSIELIRLSGHYSFDADVLERISEVAETQRNTGWAELRAGIPQTTTFSADGYKAVEVLDIRPAEYAAVAAYHLPMANGLTEHVGLRVATLAAALPLTRFIAFGNPGAPSQSSGRLPLNRLARVWKGGLRPTIEPAMLYLEQQGIQTADHIGYSYGADKAATAAANAAAYGQTVKRGVFVEPASVGVRSLFKLGRDFVRSGGAMAGYMQDAANPAYLEAFRAADRQGYGKAGFALGVMRASNIAAAHALSRGGFALQTGRALIAQPEMRTTVAWGSASEIAAHGLILWTVGNLQRQFGAGRLRRMILAGDSHAMGDDVFLHTATIMQALK